jgi:hypothetical protein
MPCAGRMHRADPRTLPDSPFAVSEARALGIPAGRLRSSDLIAPFHGVRAPRSMPATTTRERCALLLPRLSGAHFFCHLTAADLWGLPLPPWAEREPLHVGARVPAREPRLPGVVGHRLAGSHDDLTLRGGLPVTSAAVTWASLSTALTVDELIAAGDALLTAGACEKDDLLTSIRVGARGVTALREAAVEIRHGSESPRETQTRLVLVRAGMPMPQLNWQLRDARGRFVARLDLAYPRYRTCVEYDGRHHATDTQFARDADRWAAIADQGWTMVRVLSHHFDDPHRRIVGPVGRALRSAGWPG